MREELRKLDEKLPDKRFLLLLGILGAATFLRFKYAFFDGMWIDEGRYSRIGKEISTHLLDYSVTSEWHGQITGHPPFYPYLIGVLNLVFAPEFAARIVSPLTSLVGIGLVYVFGKEIRDRETGLIAAALMSVNPIFWFLSERILIGATLTTMYTATVLAFWYGLQDKEYSKYAMYAAGPLTLLTVLTKQPGYALGIILPAYFVYEKQDAFKDAWEKRSIAKSKLQGVLTDTKYYISAGLGVLTITPWMLRNMKVCGFPLCSITRALKFAGRDISNPAVAHEQGLYFFVQSLPLMLTLPVAAFIGGGIVYNVLKRYESDPRDLAIRAGVYVSAVVLLLLFQEKLVPMALLTGFALFARDNFDKMAWIWAGVGIGFMSIPTVKDPRYIVFTMPALILLASRGVRGFGSWAAELVDERQATKFAVTGLIVVLLAFGSYSEGLGDVERGGYAHLEPAGYWIGDNVPEDTNIFATSDGQMRFYAHPRMAYMPPNNKSAFERKIVEKNISFVEVDVYEPAQPKWTQTGIAPYRIPNSVRVQLRNGETSRQEVVSMFNRTPDYLEPVKTYGRTRAPISGGQQSVVILYKVKRSALP